MSKTTNKRASEKGYAPKATFKVVKTKSGAREFIAVNKRAKSVCKRAGKRTHLSVRELKACVGKGSYKFYAYHNNNTDWDKGAKLVPIKF